MREHVEFTFRNQDCRGQSLEGRIFESVSYYWSKFECKAMCAYIQFRLVKMVQVLCQQIEVQTAPYICFNLFAYWA